VLVVFSFRTTFCHPKLMSPIPYLSFAIHVYAPVDVLPNNARERVFRDAVKAAAL
jgi:hypothetical protein